MKIYIAMAETEDGNRIMEKAYRTQAAAESAVALMVKDITENAGWQVIPVVEELDFVDE